MRIIWAMSVAAFSIGLQFTCPAWADPSNELDHPTGVVSSSQATVTNNATAGGMANAAQYMVNNGYFDQAISTCQKALRKNLDDCDIHKIYAEALEGKLKKEKKDNPDLYAACVREWLIVFRNEKGDERGLTLKGVGLPLMGVFYEDEDHRREAKMHLLDITGTMPRPWETDDVYIKRASRATTSVAGKLMLDNDFTAPADRANAKGNEQNDSSAVSSSSGRARRAYPEGEQSPSGGSSSQGNDALDWIKQ